MNDNCEKRFQELGYDFDKVAPPKAKYASLKRADNLLFSAGALPSDGDKLQGVGKVGEDIQTEEAARMAALCVANILRSVHLEYGSLNAIKQVVKVTGYVNSATDFANQHLVLNGASEVLLHVFGDAGVHSRSAVGVAMLPFNACVEVEVVFELA